MLSVLSVDEVEKRIGEVPGVESVTVNYAAGSATARYDETRLDVADIKSGVRQRGHESGAPAAASAGEDHKAHTAQGALPATPAPAVQKAPPAAASNDAAHQDNAAPSTPVAAAPKPSSATPATAPANMSAAPKSAPDAAAAAPAGDKRPDKAEPDKS